MRIHTQSLPFAVSYHGLHTGVGKGELVPDVKVAISYSSLNVYSRHISNDLLGRTTISKGTKQTRQVE
jgi:hypothetical protein